MWSIDYMYAFQFYCNNLVLVPNITVHVLYKNSSRFSHSEFEQAEYIVSVNIV